MWRLNTIRGFRSGQRRASMPWAIVCNQKKNPLNGDGVQVQVVVVVGHGVVVLIFASLYFFTFVLSAL
jgi:hypothetical protein